MSSPSRAAQFTKLHKILKKYYTPVEPDPSRPVLEQLLFGCLLENAHYAAAEEAYAALVHGFYDWNEVRVSTVRELAEAVRGLPEPLAAASRVKRVLQHVFEATYAFELEGLRKLNLGPAAERLKKIDGASEFAVCCVVQAALAGHSIPVDSGTLQALYAVDLIAEEDMKQGVVPGLERAVAKSKGVEFGSLLHQLGADYIADPYSSRLREILTQVDPTANERLPKRRSKRSAEPAVGANSSNAAAPAAPAEPAKTTADKARPPEKTTERKKRAVQAAAETSPPVEPSPSAAPQEEKPARKEKRTEEETPAAAKKKPGATKKRPPEGLPDKAAERPPDKSPAKPAEKSKAILPPKSKPESDTGKSRTEAADLSKRKPR